MHQQKTGILAQNSASSERKLRLRWLLALSSLPLFGIITAFGIAPQTDVQDVTISTVVEELQLPQPVLAEAEDGTADQPLWQADTIRKDDTLAAVLERLNIRNDEAVSYLTYSPAARTLPTKLRPGRSILAQTSESGELLELKYQYDDENALTVKHTEDGYQAVSSEIQLEQHTLLKSAEITSSLFGATDAAGIPDSIAMQMVNLFSSDIDFHLDLRKGDHFTVIYEADYSDGEMTGTGTVLAAEFVNQGKTYQAFLYRDASGKQGYYTADGKSSNKAFLRSPVEFSRISSGFSHARYHPVLKKWRAHKGVDYAAPTGTRIKATASGKVVFAGRKGGYGNAVILQHSNGITTLYGHLSRFASGLRNGARVAQGDIIGYVGSTGLASGPHLHYEFRVHGQHRNPLTIALPKTESLTSSQLAQFKQQTLPLHTQLAMMRSYTTASLQ